MSAGQAPAAAAGDLEERLRSLILSNAEKQLGSQAQHGGPRGHAAESQLKPASPPTASKTSRKRPNQAQRRQMSAQLSIPVDTRPAFHQSPRHPDHPQPYAARGQQHRSHRQAQGPQSAALGPGRSNSIPSGPLARPQFPPRARHQPSFSYHGPPSTPDHLDWRQPPAPRGDPRVPYQMPPLHPMPFNTPPPPVRSGHAPPDLESPGRPFGARHEEVRAQVEMLEGLCNTIIADAEIEPADIIEKENFRARIEKVARAVIADHERNHNGFHDFPPESVQLKCFGSLASGFATKAADMDLGLLSPLSRVPPDAPGSPIPRLIEKAFLDIGLGARLLSRTRVPIIKVCEKPPEALRLSLLKEREKWDKGAAATEDVEEDEIHEDADPHLAEDIQSQTQSQPQPQPQSQSPSQSQSQSQAPSLSRPQPQSQSPSRQQDRKEEEHSHEEGPRPLKQTESCSLAAYYAFAKRLLRKLGGRDLTYSNISQFEMQDQKLLNEVCLAFVDGLADSKLRERLLSYRSLNRLDLTSQRRFRTLLSVFHQAEGEAMAMAWETRPVRERDDAREAFAERCVRAWRDLQNRPDYERDPLGYQKELQLAMEQLKKIPSLQLLFLSQSQYESAAKYFSRASKLLQELGGHDSRLDPTLAAVVHHYIRGIWNHGIREQVDHFARSELVWSLRDVGRRHKSLQLAREYEACLNRGLYPDEAAAKIRRYVELLRAPLARPRPGGALVALPPDSSSLLAELRLLGDPSRMAPNQPRDRFNSGLEFPKTGAGVQCDINFSAHLALQNTLLLRCYSHCDPRVRPLILFVKHWAKVRRINSPYRGTLSSYGYALMMLHYLVNIAQPFVCPNLQQLARPPPPNLTPEQIEETVTCRGYNVQFWRDEAEIQRLARENALTQNRQSVGQLLRGFFEYYAKGNSPLTTLPGRGFDWSRDVISLRTHGGLLTKQEKGWTGAKTVVEVQTAADPGHPNANNNNNNNSSSNNQPGEEAASQQPGQASLSAAAKPLEVKEIRNRYLFAIEDPFELEHNVARTVTHAGIVSIRDEFRRAWRIIRNAGRAGHGPQQQQQQQQQEDLLEDVVTAEEARERDEFAELLEELHGLGDDDLVSGEVDEEI